MIELNRPKALNALSSPLIKELNSHLAKLDQDKDVGAIVLTGGEKVFAGAFPQCISGTLTGSRRRYQRVASTMSRGKANCRMKDKTYHEVVSEKYIASWQDLTKTAKPIIAAVNGYAVTNGLTMHG